MGISFAQTTRLLAQALDGIWSRRQVAAQNIANATPGYKRVSVDFESTLRAEISRLTIGNAAVPIVVGDVTNPRHIPFSSAGDVLHHTSPSFALTRSVYSGTSPRDDKNNVDINQEMTPLAKASLRYQALSQAVAKRFSMLGSVLH